MVGPVGGTPGGLWKTLKTQQSGDQNFHSNIQKSPLPSLRQLSPEQVTPKSAEESESHEDDAGRGNVGKGKVALLEHDDVAARLNLLDKMTSTVTGMGWSLVDKEQARKPTRKRPPKRAASGPKMPVPKQVFEKGESKMAPAAKKSRKETTETGENSDSDWGVFG